METDVLVIGGGLAGCEAAWQAARRGLRVRLVEMRPGLNTPAHRTADLAELVCSNSLKSERLDAAAGLLKAEMERAGSLIVRSARRARVPAGQTLAVDRALFSAEIERALREEAGVQIDRREVRALEESGARATVVATGPLTSPALAHALSSLTGQEFLYFYDAVSPLFTAESVDFTQTFRATRYDKGDPDYVNCPLDRETYEGFARELAEAEIYPAHPFESEKFFRGCLPLEEMARAGLDTLAHGPLRPVGLPDPRTGRRPHAVVQLRAEDRNGRLVGAVGFQTRMRHGEQKRVFRMIPALDKAEFARFGSVHRNTYVCAPRLLRPTMQLGLRPRMLLAGTLCGSEGYVEAAATGLLAGVNAARVALGDAPVVPPTETMLGALVHHLHRTDPRRFQPMNANFGLLPPVAGAARGLRGRDDRNERMVTRALAAFDAWQRDRGEVCELAS